MKPKDVSEMTVRELENEVLHWRFRAADMSINPDDFEIFKAGVVGMLQSTIDMHDECRGRRTRDGEANELVERLLEMIDPNGTTFPIRRR